MTPGEAVLYLIVCTCTGRIATIAYLDDNRPAGSAISVTTPTPELKQTFSARGYKPGDEGWRAPDGFSAVASAGFNVTETVLDWETGRCWWAIRCLHCNTQAQVSSANMAAIADRLATRGFDSVPAPHPAEPVVQSWHADGWAQTEAAPDVVWRHRKLIALGVLVAESQRNG